MRRNSFNRWVLAALVLSTATWSACDKTNPEKTPAASAGADSKIPITTKSDEARKEFLLGRDLSEKLQAQDSVEHFDKAIALDPEFASAELARANHIAVVFSSVLPVHNYTPKSQDFFLQRSPEKIQALNHWLQDYCATNGLVYLDYFSPMVDDKGLLKRDLAEDGRGAASGHGIDRHGHGARLKEPDEFVRPDAEALPVDDDVGGELLDLERARIHLGDGCLA